ncbi:MAG: glycoside hydrolase family 55 protein [Angustibacter sp.]
MSSHRATPAAAHPRHVHKRRPRPVVAVLLIAVVAALGVVLMTAPADPPASAGRLVAVAVQENAQVSTAKASPAPRGTPATASSSSSTGSTSSARPVAAANTSVGARGADRVTLPDDIMKSVKDFGAIGDGRTDDTAALQRALADGRGVHNNYNGRPKMLYFPAGEYRVTDTLSWGGCCVTLQGAGPGATTIRLPDGAAGFGDPGKPKPVIRTPAGNMSFRQNVHGLTIDTGRGNRGAVGLDFVGNNQSTVDNVVIRSGDGTGVAGLSMDRAWPGPLLVKDVTVDGFARGVSVSNEVNSVTMERVTVRGQSEAGVRVGANSVAIRSLRSENAVPAVIGEGAKSALTILDSELTGGSAGRHAIESAGELLVRNVRTSGYASAVSSRGRSVPGATVNEYVAGARFELFGGQARTLNLPIKESADAAQDPVGDWARFAPGGYNQGKGKLQPLLDSGHSTIYFSGGGYMFPKGFTVTVPPTVKRIVGFDSVINGNLVFRVVGATSTPLIIERFGYGVTVEHSSPRPVVVRHGMMDYREGTKPGPVFLDDLTSAPLSLTQPHQVWARQLNIEANETMITNTAADLWILGLKTEQAGTVIETSGTGRTELLGGLIYPASQVPQGRPAFVLRDQASMSLSYAVASYVGGTNYRTQIVQTRGGTTRSVLSGDLPPSGRMPLFSGGP